MATLRRPFRYSDDSEPEAMDEQEQDQFISSLAAANNSQNALFTRLLLALPLLSSIAYLPALLHPSTAVFALLAITSLLIDAFLLHTLPPTETGIALIDVWARRDSTPRRKPRTASSVFASSTTTTTAASSKSPLQRYLPYLNLALATLLILMGIVRPIHRGGGFGWVSMGNLPALVYSSILCAKVVMAAVDPERDLAHLRYEFKGA